MFSTSRKDLYGDTAKGGILKKGQGFLLFQRKEYRRLQKGKTQELLQKIAKETVNFFSNHSPSCNSEYQSSFCGRVEHNSDSFSMF